MEKKMREYIGVSRIKRLIIAGLVALVVLLAGVSIYFYKTADKGEAELFDPISSEDGSFCYFDAVGVSDWIFWIKETKGSAYTLYKYHILEDADGGMVIAALEDDEYEKMYPQQKYWNRKGEFADQPEPYRIKGTAKLDMIDGSDLQKNLAGVTALTGKEFASNFGYLSLYSSSSPRSQIGGKIEAAAIFAGVFAFIFALLQTGGMIGTSVCTKRLKELGLLEQAAEEFGSGIDFYGCMVTDNFIFVKNEGYVFAFEDIKKATCAANYIILETEVYNKVNIRTSSEETASILFKKIKVRSDMEEKEA